MSKGIGDIAGADSLIAVNYIAALIPISYLYADPPGMEKQQICQDRKTFFTLSS